ncbi:YjcQ family protein [Blautia sp. JLR.GB0024]|uniref:YjcQ family protein n=1 Tax=Blautia sp. JLR.GB0024 TaxID=3123295 RepID=UPI003003C74F
MDNFKSIYKILRELERNMGNEQFEIYQVSADKLKIPYERWEQLLIMLLDNDYISGIVVSQDLEDKFRHIAEPIQPYITLKGLEYLANNTFMEKAKEVLRLAGEIL